MPNESSEVLSTQNRTTLFVRAVVVLSVVLAVTIAAIKISRPDDTTTSTTLVQILGPIITALLAGALQGVHVLVNSKYDNVRSELTETNRLLTEARAIIVEQRSHIAKRRDDPQPFLPPTILPPVP